jgi:hypothetical protein
VRPCGAHICPAPAPTFDVQMTSRRCTFIQLSHCTMCPLYVSPFFSSTSCSIRRGTFCVASPHQPSRFAESGFLIHLRHLQCTAPCGQQQEQLLTTGCFCAVLSRSKGNMAVA